VSIGYKSNMDNLIEQRTDTKYYTDITKVFWNDFWNALPSYVPKKSKNAVFFIFQNIASAYNAAINQQFLENKHISTVYHQPYSPNLYPSDYFAFPMLKLDSKGDRFEIIEYIQKDVTDKLQTIIVEAFQKATKDLKTRSVRCIEVGEDYFE